jgi:hypothetical protein
LFLLLLLTPIHLHNQRLLTPNPVMQTRTISLSPFKIQFGTTLCHQNICDEK